MKIKLLSLILVILVLLLCSCGNENEGKKKYDTIYLNVSCRKGCKGCGAHYHNGTAYYPGEYAEKHISADVIQYVLRLKEDARADDDTDYHAYRCE